MRYTNQGCTFEIAGIYEKKKKKSIRNINDIHM